MEESKQFKQRLYRIHSSLGISISLIMYVSLFFGIFAIFLSYIYVWESPSFHFDRSGSHEINYEKMIDTVLSEPDYPQSNVMIELPGSFNEPTLRIGHRFAQRYSFNPKTEEIIEETEEPFLAFFLNEMHYGRPLLYIGDLIFGFASVGTMLLIVGGFMLIIYLKFKNKGKNQQASFSKWHKKIFIYTSPIFLLIALTGVLMTIGHYGSTYMTSIISKGESDNFSSYTRKVSTKQKKFVNAINEDASMMRITELIKKAKNINTSLIIKELKLINWKDKTAQVEITGYNPYKPFFNGINNREKIILNAIDGSLISQIKAFDASWTVLFTEALYFIHLLFSVDIFLRIIVAILMLLSCFAIGFGVMLWLEKKAKVYDKKIVFYHWFGKLSLAVIIGVIPATGLLIFTQWFLPSDFQNKIIIQQIIFFLSWQGTLVWSFYRTNSYKAAKEFLFLGGILFIFSSLIHFIASGYSPFALYKGGMYEILSVDITFILFGILLLISSKKLPKTREQSKLFWNKNYKGTNNA